VAIAIVWCLTGRVNAEDIYPTRTIAHPEPAAGDAFGKSVAVAGNFLCVGAPGRNSAEGDRVGIVYVFDRETEQLLGTISPPSPAAFLDFGDNIVGVGDDKLLTLTGIGHLFSLTDRQLISPIPDIGEQTSGFGWKGASDGTLIAVSDLYEDNLNASGRVHLYDAASGDYLRSIDHPNQTGQGSSLGTALLFDGPTLYIGSMYSRTIPSTGSGEAYAVRISDGAPLATYPDATFGQNLLGGALAVVGGKIAVGPSYDDGFPYGYLYCYEGTDPVPVLTIRSPGLQNQNMNDNFGKSMATAPDGTLLVGAPRGPYNAVGTRAGVIYSYDPVDGTPLHRYLPPPSTTASVQLGLTMDVYGSRVYVGAPSSEFSSEPGDVYIFDFATAASTGLTVR